MSVDTKPVPLKISRANQWDVHVEWSDGHDVIYPARYLRLNCSCAGCVEEFTGKRVLDPASVVPDVHPMGIEPVGRYGIRIHWSDGHNTGIYTYENLRRICPCPPCGNSEAARAAVPTNAVETRDVSPVAPAGAKGDRASLPLAVAALTTDSSLDQIISAIPGAQKVMHDRFHIGGCQSCGFDPKETLISVCARNRRDPKIVLAVLQEAARG